MTSISPYLAYYNTPNFSQNGLRQHNSDGYRNSYETPRDSKIKIPLEFFIAEVSTYLQ